MTTAVIEQIANRGSIATADFLIGMIHRLVVIPAFLEDVGDGAWRRKYATITGTVSSAGPYSLPADFGKVVDLYPPYQMPSDLRNPGEAPLKYMGEDPDQVAQALLNTTNAPPLQFWVVPDPGQSSQWKAVQFDSPCDQAYVFQAVYNWNIVWADPGTWTASKDLSPYIPEELQPALVHGLRAEIMKDRYGVGDNRYRDEWDSRNMWIERAINKLHLARRDYAVYVK